MNNNNSTIVHISDPHFGTEDSATAAKLIKSIDDIRPDVVVVSGDLTQRALNKQYKKAKSFLDNIPFPKLVIPGNHDIPLYNLFRRFTKPFAKYHRFISDEEYPEYQSDKIALIGVNSCTPFRSQSGRVKDEYIEHLKIYFAEIDKHKIKGVVVHHNIIPFEGLKGSSVLVNAEKFLSEMNKCGVDLIFAGHLHKSLAMTYNETGIKNNLLMLQAGTCMSHRIRKEKNTFLIIKTGPDKIDVNFRIYTNGEFSLDNIKSFERTQST